MAHYEKYHITDVKKLLEHDNRTNTDERENVDHSRSHLNYNLHSVKDEYKFFRDKLEFVKNNGGTVRADSVVMISEIVTLPEDYPENEELERQFFAGVYEYTKKKYGEENIISAWVHRDENKKNENRPNKSHIHIKVLPIVKTKKKYKNGSEKERLALNANKILNKEYLQKYHKELGDFLEDWLGFRPSIENGATKDGNKTIKELKKTSEQQKKDRELINKDPWLIIAEQKKILNDYWEEYKRISQKYWADYKLQKNIISNSIYELKKDIKGTERDLKRSLDFVGNLSYGLFYALSRLVCAFCMYYRVNTLQNELKTIESNLGALEDVRRTVSNHQHNTKEKLKNNDLISIEEALENWEKSAFGINAKIRDNMRKRENEIQIPEREEIEL